MDHALDVLLQHCAGVGCAAEIGVAGVEEQEHFRRVGELHQHVDVLRRLHIRAHVVVVGQADAVVRDQVRAKSVQPLSIGLPQRRVGKLRTPRYRGVDLPLHRARTFAVDHNRHAVVVQLFHVCFAAGNFCRDRLCVVLAGFQLCQKARVPTRHAGQLVGIELRFEAGTVFGEFIAQLKPRVADFFAFAQRRFQRCFAAEFGQVVVHPADGVDTYAYVPAHAIFLVGVVSKNRNQIFTDAAPSWPAHRPCGPRSRLRSAKPRAPRLPTSSRRHRCCGCGWCRSR